MAAVLPLALFTNAALSVWVARLYRDDLRRVFLYLAGFLALYGLTNIEPLMEATAGAVPAQFPGLVLVLQLTDYAMLLLACVDILQVVQVRRLNRGGRIIMGFVALGALYIVSAALFPSLASLEGIATGRWASWSDAFGQSFVDEIRAVSLPVITYVLVRTFDAAVLVMLVPVLLLYIQNAKAQYQESLTFSVVVAGVIASLISAYAYELVSRRPLLEIAVERLDRVTPLDVLYIFGYLTVAVGLYAHRKHQQWSLGALDRLLG